MLSGRDSGPAVILMWLQHVVVSDKHIELVETDRFRGIQVWRILQALNTTLARLALNLANNTNEWSVQICLGSLNVPWLVCHGLRFPRASAELVLESRTPEVKQLCQ